MTIYRCDKCKKDIPYEDPRYRIKMEAEIYDDCMNNWRPSRKTVYYDVCYNCAVDIMTKFVNDFEMEGYYDENIS